MHSKVVAYMITCLISPIRDVGPDSNGSFRSNLDANKMSLVSILTQMNIPPCTHWAIDKK